MVRRSSKEEPPAHGSESPGSNPGGASSPCPRCGRDTVILDKFKVLKFCWNQDCHWQEEHCVIPKDWEMDR